MDNSRLDTIISQIDELSVKLDKLDGLSEIYRLMEGIEMPEMPEMPEVQRVKIEEVDELVSKIVGEFKKDNDKQSSQLREIASLISDLKKTIANIGSKDNLSELAKKIEDTKKLISSLISTIGNEATVLSNEIKNLGEIFLSESKKKGNEKNYEKEIKDIIKKLDEINLSILNIRPSSSLIVKNKSGEQVNPATEDTLSDVKSVLTDIRNNFENKLFDLTIGGTSYDYSFTIQEANTFYAIPHEVTVGSRALLIIQNISDEDVYICFRNTSSIGAGIKLFPGQTFSIFIKNNPLYVYSLVNNVKINYNFVRLLP